MSRRRARSSSSTTWAPVSEPTRAVRQIELEQHHDATTTRPAAANRLRSQTRARAEPPPGPASIDMPARYHPAVSASGYTRKLPRAPHEGHEVREPAAPSNWQQRRATPRPEETVRANYRPPTPLHRCRRRAGPCCRRLRSRDGLPRASGRQRSGTRLGRLRRSAPPVGARAATHRRVQARHPKRDPANEHRRTIALPAAAYEWLRQPPQPNEDLLDPRDVPPPGQLALYGAAGRPPEHAHGARRGGLAERLRERAASPGSTSLQFSPSTSPYPVAIALVRPTTTGFPSASDWRRTVVAPEYVFSRTGSATTRAPLEPLSHALEREVDLDRDVGGNIGEHGARLSGAATIVKPTAGIVRATSSRSSKSRCGSAPIETTSCTDRPIVGTERVCVDTERHERHGHASRPPCARPTVSMSSASRALYATIAAHPESARRVQPPACAPNRVARDARAGPIAV